MSKEKRLSSVERRLDSPELEKTADKQREVLRDQVEQKAEQSGEKTAEKLEKSRAEARELAQETEKHHEDDQLQAEKAETKQPPINSKKARQAAYDNTMGEMRSHLKPSSRTFSKVIHQPAVERVSEVAGKTVARPNAILGGSLMAFVTVLGVFLVARHYGYPLSGSETIVAFAAGWVLGVLFDYLRLLITGRPSV